MQFVELNSFAQTFLTWLTSRGEFIAASLLAIALVLWVCTRTGSSYMLNKRLWRLANGKQEVKSPILSRFVDEQDDLMYVRALTGLKRIPTAAAAERMVDWLKKWDIDADLVCAAGRHFDLDVPGFAQRPAKKGLLALFMIAVALLYGGLSVGGVGASTPPVFQVKASQVWYAVTDREARRYQFKGDPTRTIDASNCNDVPAAAKATSYPEHDVQVMCELMSTERGKEARRQAQFSQIALATLVSLALFLGATAVLRALWRLAKANELYKKLEQRKQTEVRSEALSGGADETTMSGVQTETTSPPTPSAQ